MPIVSYDVDNRHIFEEDDERLTASFFDKHPTKQAILVINPCDISYFGANREEGLDEEGLEDKKNELMQKLSVAYLDPKQKRRRF